MWEWSCVYVFVLVFAFLWSGEPLDRESCATTDEGGASIVPPPPFQLIIQFQLGNMETMIFQQYWCAFILFQYLLPAVLPEPGGDSQSSDGTLAPVKPEVPKLPIGQQIPRALYENNLIDLRLKGRGRRSIVNTQCTEHRWARLSKYFALPSANKLY